MDRIDEVFVEQIWWYASRASGIIAWVLLSASVLAGLMISGRTGRTLPAGWTLDLHRFLSTLSLLFLSIHMAALVPDNYVHFAWAEIFLPYGSEWNPGSVALGVVAFWLMLAVEATSLVRQRIPTRLWRSIHFLSFVVWAGATAHLLYAGSDADHVVFRVAQIVVVGGVLGMTIYRVIMARRRRSRSRAPVRRQSSGPGALPIEEPVHVDEIDSGERRELSA